MGGPSETLGLAAFEVAGNADFRRVRVFMRGAHHLRLHCVEIAVGVDFLAFEIQRMHEVAPLVPLREICAALVEHSAEGSGGRGGQTEGEVDGGPEETVGAVVGEGEAGGAAEGGGLGLGGLAVEEEEGAEEAGDGSEEGEAGVAGVAGLHHAGPDGRHYALIFRLSNNINTMPPTNPNKPLRPYLLLSLPAICP